MKHCFICEKLLDKKGRYATLLREDKWLYCWPDIWLHFCSTRCKKKYLDYAEKEKLDVVDEINKPLKDKLRDIEELEDEYEENSIRGTRRKR